MNWAIFSWMRFNYMICIWNVWEIEWYSTFMHKYLTDGSYCFVEDCWPKFSMKYFLVQYTMVIGLQNSLHWIKIKVIKKIGRFYLTQLNALCILYVQLKWWTRETLVLKLHGEQMLYFPIYFDFWESKIDGLNNLVPDFLKLHSI